MRRIGIDVGGTNTDAVVLDDGLVVHAIKTPTTPNVTTGILTALAGLADHPDVAGRTIDGVVIGTEYEPNKAAAARAHFEQAGLSRFVDLREGDLRQTLKQIDGPVDFMLMDIWITMARPALELVTPHLRPGAIVIV